MRSAPSSALDCVNVRKPRHLEPAVIRSRRRRRGDSNHSIASRSNSAKGPWPSTVLQAIVTMHALPSALAQSQIKQKTTLFERAPLPWSAAVCLPTVFLPIASLNYHLFSASATQQIPRSNGRATEHHSDESPLPWPQHLRPQQKDKISCHEHRYDCENMEWQQENCRRQSGTNGNS